MSNVWLKNAAMHGPNVLKYYHKAIFSCLSFLEPKPYHFTSIKYVFVLICFIEVHLYNDIFIVVIIRINSFSGA